MRLFPTLLLCLAALPAFASEKVNYPAVVKGRMQLEYLGFADGEQANGEDRLRQRVQVTYGLTDRIDLALSAQEENESGSRSQFVGPSARIRYELTRQEDDWWLSSAVQTRYVRATDGRADTLVTRALFQREQQDWLATVNFGIVRGLGAERQDSAGVSGAAQLVYRYDPLLSPGVEFFTGLDRLNDVQFDGQSRELGPIVTGELKLTADESITYVLGYYRGLNDVAPEQSGKLQLNYLRQF